MKIKYYQESGEINHLSFALGLIALLGLTMIWGYSYALLIHFIPLIYLNLLVTVCFGIVLEYSVRLIIRLTKNRNKQSRIILTVIAVFLATYFQWAAFLDSILLESFPNPKEYLFLLDWIIHPTEFFGLIGQIYEYGTWGIGMVDFQVNGILLVGVWLVEIFLSALPSIKMINSFELYPFSEKFNKWYPKYLIFNDFESIVSRNSIESKLDESVLETLKDLKPGSGIKHSKIYLYYHEGEEHQYLSIDRIFIEGKGKGKTNRTSVIKNYRIDTSTAKDVQKEFRLKREKIDII